MARAGYFFPYVVARSPRSGRGLVKREVVGPEREALRGYKCCACDRPWPGCSCPETEDEMAAWRLKHTTEHWSVQVERDSRAAFVAQGGCPQSISALRKWEWETRGSPK